MMMLGNPSGQDVNALRELMRRGLLKESDLANMAVSESEPARSPNALAEIMNPLMSATAGQGFQGLASGQGVVQATNPDGTQGAPIRIDSGPAMAQGAPRDWSRVEVDTPNGRGYYGKDGKIYTPDGAVTTMQPVGTQARRNAEQDRLMKMREMEARILQTESATRENDAQTKLLSQPPKPKLGMGETMGADGSVQMIPGTAGYLKQADKHAKDYGLMQAVETKTDNAIKKIDEILAPKNGGDGKELNEGFQSQFGGYNAYLTRLLPGETQDIGAKIDSLKANMKTAGLELIRQGGSIGQMTEREWPIVQDQLDKLDPKMGEAAAKVAFENIRANMERIRENAKEVYATEWGGTQFGKPVKPKDGRAKPSGNHTSEAEYNALPKGATYMFNGKKLVKQ